MVRLEKGRTIAFRRYLFVVAQGASRIGSCIVEGAVTRTVSLGRIGSLAIPERGEETVAECGFGWHVGRRGWSCNWSGIVA